MDTIKDRNDTDLTGAEDIKKRWQEYTEELFLKNSFLNKMEKRIQSFDCGNKL